MATVRLHDSDLIVLRCSDSEWIVSFLNMRSQVTAALVTCVPTLEYRTN